VSDENAANTELRLRPKQKGGATVEDDVVEGAIRGCAD
jgi:hypothetical protein